MFLYRYVGFYQFTLPGLLIKDIDLLKQLAIKEFDSFTDHRQVLDYDVEPLFKNLISLKGIYNLLEKFDFQLCLCVSRTKMERNAIKFISFVHQ